MIFAAGCEVHTSNVNKGDRCFEVTGKEVSCQPFLSKLQQQEITASVEITDYFFTINSVTLPAENRNFLCGLTPQSGKRYEYSFRDQSLIVETDGKILRFRKDNGSISSILGVWICVESNDRLLSAAHLNFINNKTLRIHQLCR